MIAEVIVDIAHSEVDKIFDYQMIDDVELGSRVKVPFGLGNKLIEGYVIGIKEQSDWPIEKIKKIERVVDCPLSAESLFLMHTLSKRYQQPKASILRLFLPSEMRKGNVHEKIEQSVIFVEENLNSAVLSKGAKKQLEAVTYFQQERSCKLAEANKKFGNTAIQKLIEKGILKKVEEQVFRKPYSSLEDKSTRHTLTQEQQLAVEKIQASEKQVQLLHGVTGSGKTEIYLHAITNCLRQGKTAIFLVPEIALTPQMLKSLRGRFQGAVAILHSKLSAGERFDEWTRLKEGEAKIAVGARGAIFAPVENVGLIVVDEEHDASYQSESMPRYNAVQVAKMRAKYNKCKIILGSATPSIESYLYAQNGQYNLIELHKRVNEQILPEIVFADMRQELRNGNDSIFSEILQDEIEERLQKKEQIILFLNRRGYAQSVQCKQCGYVHTCSHCDVALTYHRVDNILKCHFCGSQYTPINNCVNCNSTALSYNGFGTQQVVEELQKLYPNAIILRMDNDTTSGKEGHLKITEEFAKGNADILVGTQMVAKGHDFPNVTLVGILNADQGLYFDDFRSNERTFQLIMQVAGRSGRGQKAGKVILQTYNSQNQILRYAVDGNYKVFFENEINLRQATYFPPYTIIVRVLISSEKKENALNALKKVYNKIEAIYLKDKDAFIFLHKMVAPVKKLQNKWRYQILMRLLNKNLLPEIYTVVSETKEKNTIIDIEENPSNLQ